MNFNDINGVWRQIKAYIDNKFSSIASSTFNTLRNGVYYYTKQGTYITPNQYQDSVKPNILGIAVYWDGYSFLVGGSYKSDIKYGNMYNAEEVKVYCPSSNLKVGSKIQESVDSIVNMTNILYKDSIAYLKKQVKDLVVFKIIHMYQQMLLKNLQMILRLTIKLRELQ